MRAKLNRPGSWLSYDLANLVPGRQIDAEILDELETRLLTADVGVEATTSILDELRRKVARKELADHLVALGYEMVSNTPEQFAAFLRDDAAQWLRLIKMTGASAE